MKGGELMNVICLHNGVDYRESLPSGDVLQLRMRDIRHEHTGTHAHIGVLLGNNVDGEEERWTVLDSDDFNVKRRDPRNKLSNSAHSMLSEMLKMVISRDKLQHLLLEFCLVGPQAWDSERLRFEEIDPTEEAPPTTYAVWPFVLNGGGTMAFGMPASGKSMFCQILAVSIASGQSTIWEIPFPRPVLYINIERPRHTMISREAAIRKVLGIKGGSGVSYLHARGAALDTIDRTVTKFIQDRPDAIIILDSISRAGQGTLVADDVANKIIDLLNSYPTWLGIGHSPRDNADHSYGSMQFEAGPDMVCKVSSERRDNILGVRLEVVKMNDGRIPRPEYYALTFAEDDSGLIGFKRSHESEFPELSITTLRSPTEKITHYILENGPSDAQQIASATGLQRSNTSALLNSSHLFVKMPMTPGSKIQDYALATTRTES